MFQLFRTRFIHAAKWSLCGLAIWMIDSRGVAQQPGTAQPLQEATISVDPTNSGSQAADSAEASVASTERKKAARKSTSITSTKLPNSRMDLAPDSSATAAKTLSTEPKAGGSKSSRLRLPRYFAGIVDNQQRESILMIQSEYQTKIAELETEIARVRLDEQEAVESILTPAQRKLLDKKRSGSRFGSPNDASEMDDAELPTS